MSSLLESLTTPAAEDATTVQTWWLIQLICRLTIDMSSGNSTTVTSTSTANSTVSHNLQCVHNNTFATPIGNYSTTLYNESDNHHCLYYRCTLLTEHQSPSSVSSEYTRIVAQCKSTEPPLAVFADDEEIFKVDNEFPRNVNLKVFNGSSIADREKIPHRSANIMWLTLPKFPDTNITNNAFHNARLECSSSNSLRLFGITSFQDEPFLCTFQRTDENSADSWHGKYDWTFLFVIVFIAAGGIGNVLVCLAVCLDKRLQNVTNYFLLSLAIADLLVSLFVMPLGGIQGFFGYWPLGVAWCNVYVTCDVLACSSSIMHMCCISLGRYLGIRNPLKTRHKYATKRLVGIKIALVWALSIAVSGSVTFLGLHNSRNIMPEPNVCVINNRAFFVFGSLVAFYIPMLIMVVTYALTVQLLRKKARFLEHKPGTGSGGCNSELDTFRRLGGRFQKSTTIRNSYSEKISQGTESSFRKAKRTLSTPLSRNSFNRTPFFRRSRCSPKGQISTDSNSGSSPAEDGANIATISEISVSTSNGQESPSKLSITGKSTRLRNLRLQLNATPSALNLRFLANKTKRQNVTSAANAVRTEQKASKVLGLVFFTFVLCWAPFFVLNILFAVCPKPRCQVPGNVVDVTLWLGYVSSTINPIIYTIFNRTFRAAFIRLLQFKCHKFSNPVHYRSVTDNRTSSGILAHIPSGAAAGIAVLPISVSLQSTVTPSSTLVTPLSITGDGVPSAVTMNKPPAVSQSESFELAEISEINTSSSGNEICF